MSALKAYFFLTYISSSSIMAPLGRARARSSRRTRGGAGAGAAASGLSRTAGARPAGARRSQLAAYLGVAADDVVYVPNPTTAINMVARSLHLRPTDEILTTDHEYGAMGAPGASSAARPARGMCGSPSRCPSRMPTLGGDLLARSHRPHAGDFSQSYYQPDGAHVASGSDLPARAAGVLSIVDGAHVPGHLRSICRRSGRISTRGPVTNGSAPPRGGVPLCPPRGPSLVGAPRGQLGLRERPAQRLAVYRLSRVAGDARPGGVPDRAHGHRVPGPARVGGGAPAVS